MAARAKSSCFLPTAISALRFQSEILSSFSFCFFSSRCWSAIAIATCVFTWSNWFSMSRMTCLIMISGCSALSINSFKFARTNVETLSSNAITPPNHFQLPLQLTCLQIQTPCPDVAGLEMAAARCGRANQHADGNANSQPDNPAAYQERGQASYHCSQHQSDE